MTTTLLVILTLTSVATAVALWLPAVSRFVRCRRRRRNRRPFDVRNYVY